MHVCCTGAGYTCYPGVALSYMILGTNTTTVYACMQQCLTETSWPCTGITWDASGDDKCFTVGLRVIGRAGTS